MVVHVLCLLLTGVNGITQLGGYAVGLIRLNVELSNAVHMVGDNGCYTRAKVSHEERLWFAC